MQAAKTGTSVLKVFREHDADGSGELDPGELHQAVSPPPPFPRVHIANAAPLTGQAGLPSKVLKSLRMSRCAGAMVNQRLSGRRVRVEESSAEKLSC